MQNSAGTNYFKIKKILFLANAILTMIFLFIMAYAFSRPLREFVRNLTGSSIIVITIYFLLFYLFYFLFTFALKYYEGFILEGQSRNKKQNFQEWMKELIQKELVIFTLLMLIVQTVYFFLETNPRIWWLPISIVCIIARNIYEFLPDYIVPLFLKCRPLEDKQLKERLIKLSIKADMNISDVLLCRGAKPKVTILGLGTKRRLILNDVILNFAPEEIEVLLCQEIANFHYGSIWKGPLMDAIGIILTFLAVSILLPFCTERFGFEFMFDIETLPVLLGLFFIIYLSVCLALNYFKQGMMRSNDVFALKLSRAPDAFISLIVRAASEENVNKHQATYFLESMIFSKTSTAQRIMLAQDFAQNFRYESMSQKFQKVNPQNPKK